MKTTDIFSIFIQSGFFVVLLSFVVSGIKCAKAFVDTKTAEATAKIKDTNVKSAINSAEDCVTTVVAELSQTVVDDLKAKAADGKLTADEAKQIQADALAKVQSLISTDVYNTLITVFGDADAWIKSKIEAAVRVLKASTATIAAISPNKCDHSSGHCHGNTTEQADNSDVPQPAVQNVTTDSSTTSTVGTESAAAAAGSPA